jgi:hypothetical protein
MEGRREVNEERRKGLEALSALGGTSLWIEALAEEAQSEEVERLTGVLKTDEVGRFLEDPPPRKKTKAMVARPCPVPAAHFLWRA